MALAYEVWMVVALYMIAFAMVLGGSGILVRGAPFITVDWGSTMVIAGTIAASSGALLAGLAAAVGHLKRVERELVEARERAASPERPSPQPVIGAPAAFGAREPLLDPVLPADGAPVVPVALPREARPAGAMPAPIQVDRMVGDGLPPAPRPVGAREPPPPPRPAVGAAPVEAPAGSAAGPRPFPSAVPEFLARPRGDRAPPAPMPAFEEPDLAEPAPTVPAPDLAKPSLARPPPGEPAAVATAKAPSVQPIEHPVPSAETVLEPAILPTAAAEPTPLADAEPPSVPTKPPGTPAEHRASEAAAEPAPAVAPAAPAPEPGKAAEARPHEGAEALVIGTYSSGGNSYVMFSDGSIEAETPNGKFRFKSLDELKDFIASGGEKAASATA